MAFLKSKLLPRFGPSGGSGNAVLEGAEHERHQELERLYTSTRAGKHFQKDIVKGVEGFLTTGNKQLEVSNKLAEDCKRYGLEGPSVKETLSRATQQYGSARNQMEKARETMHRVLASQVAEPLKAMVHSAPLEDARHLKQKYDRLRQEADYQATDVSKRKSRDAGGNPDHAAKLQVAEQKLEEIISSMQVMGKNATHDMSAVESQQQAMTLQKMLVMVEAERVYFQQVTIILDQLHYEIESEVKKATGAAARPPPTPPQPTPISGNRKQQAHPTPINGNKKQQAMEAPVPTPINANKKQQGMEAPVSTPINANKKQQATGAPAPTLNISYADVEDNYQDKSPPSAESKSFYATVTLDYEAEEEGELSIAVGDEILVRQVTASGWSEGICNGEEGWFPSAYVEKKESVRRGRGRAGSGHSSR